VKRPLTVDKQLVTVTTVMAPALHELPALMFVQVPIASHPTLSVATCLFRTRPFAALDTNEAPTATTTAAIDRIIFTFFITLRCLLLIILTYSF
jgi:hypothetical protein